MKQDTFKLLNVKLQSSDNAEEICEVIIHSLCKDLAIFLSEHSIV